MIGQLLAGRYELQELAGSGGMSSVYRARDTVLERTVAIKILHEHYSDDAEYVERFRREARALAQLNHPNIVTVIDRGEYEGRQFIVFEYVEGENLKELIDREGPLPVEQALALVAPGRARACVRARARRRAPRREAAQRPHRRGRRGQGDGLRHRALARPRRTASPRRARVLGTSEYIAPEQASGRRVDERSDQYSLGVVLYELLTGEPPFTGDNFMAVAMRHIQRAGARAFATRRPDVLAAARRDRRARDGEATRTTASRRPRRWWRRSRRRSPTPTARRLAARSAAATRRDESIPVAAAAAAAASARGSASAAALVGARRRRLAALVIALVVAGGGTDSARPGRRQVASVGGDRVHLSGAERLRPGRGRDGASGGRAAATDGELDRRPGRRSPTSELRQGGCRNRARRGRGVDRSELTVTTDTPGYTAVIEACEPPRRALQVVSEQPDRRGADDLRPRGRGYATTSSGSRASTAATDVAANEVRAARAGVST